MNSLASAWRVYRARGSSFAQSARQQLSAPVTSPCRVTASSHARRGMARTSDAACAAATACLSALQQPTIVGLPVRPEGTRILLRQEGGGHLRRSTRHQRYVDVAALFRRDGVDGCAGFVFQTNALQPILYLWVFCARSAAVALPACPLGRWSPRQQSLATGINTDVEPSLERLCALGQHLFQLHQQRRMLPAGKQPLLIARGNNVAPALVLDRDDGACFFLEAQSAVAAATVRPSLCHTRRAAAGVRVDVASPLTRAAAAAA